MRLLWWKKDATARKGRQEDFEEGGGDDSTLELSHVGPYEVIAPIGAGGMGTVYKAIDRSRDQTIAVKVLHSRFDMDKRRKKRDYLGREILIAASLQHPCIIRMSKEIIEQEDSNGNIRRCLLMEYVDGYNMRKLINDQSLDLRQKIDICIRLCEGLDFLHQHQVVHQDIKPENFLFSRDMTHAKIVDFGVSKSTASWRTRWVKEGGGTRRYMSPEQLAKKSVDGRSDIFSFGLTMYELLTGRHPCNGRDAKEILMQLRSSKYKFQPPSKYDPAIPPQLDKIVLKALRRNPERRYQSVTEMLMDLTRLRESRL